jgi:hypothetical protein
MAVPRLLERSRGVLPGRGQSVPPAEWQPRRIGPRFQWLDHETIELQDGPLAGRRFGVRTVIKQTVAELSLFEGTETVGEVSIERDPPGRGVVLWDIGVRARLRGNGLAALMSWCIFRELLLEQPTATFRIRMVRSLRTGTDGAQVQNVGICVVAARLGFEPEMNVDAVLKGQNVTDMTVIPRQNGTPPCLKISIRTVPLMLMAFVLDPQTMKPVTDERVYGALDNDKEAVRDWAHLGRLTITNGNYCLRKSQVERFADILAIDAMEAKLFRARVRGL